MNEYDLVVVGGGSGTEVATAGASMGLDVALVEEGPLGGTCLTRGCDPSKALVHRADLVETVENAAAFGIDATVSDVAFADIVEEVNATFEREAAELERTVRDGENLTLYGSAAKFVDERTVAVDGEPLAGEVVVVATGARPVIPSSVDGLDGVDYSTSRDALRFDERPDELVIVGGGYVAAEMGHLFGTLGSEVTIVGRSDLLVGREDRDVAELVTEVFERRYDVHTGYEATAASEVGGAFTVRAEDEGGDEIEVTGDELLVATGRKPDTDRLNLEVAGVETDGSGSVKTDAYLETTAENVWALGDVIGERPFKHAANREARYVIRNALGDTGRRIEYPGMAHAIFTSPQVASTGKTEGELEEAGHEYVVGRAEYDETAMGVARKVDEGFVKALAAPGDGTVLGCHVAGPQAATLVHEVTAATARGSGTVADVTDTIHVHPSMNEVVLTAFEDANV